MKNINFKEVEASTIVRTIVMVLTIINTILAMTGHNPLPWSEKELYSGLSVIVNVIVTLWVWWKNNSFTKAAIEADSVMRMLKLSTDSTEVDTAEYIAPELEEEGADSIGNEHTN